MKFEKSNNKFYPSWTYRDKVNDCIVHIYYIKRIKNFESGIYHFKVICRHFTISSISLSLVYLTFDECVKGIEKLRMEHMNSDKE